MKQFIKEFIFDPAMFIYFALLAITIFSVIMLINANPTKYHHLVGQEMQFLDGKIFVASCTYSTCKIITSTLDHRYVRGDVLEKIIQENQK